MLGTNPSDSMDYVSRKTSPGGSKPGRDARKPGDLILLGLYRCALATMPPPGVGEFWFYNRVGIQQRMPGRFTEAAVRPILPYLEQYLPFEWFQYTSFREEKAAHLVANRLHKMFYGTNKKAGTKGRGSGSSEHPRYWSQERRAAAEEGLRAVGWPW